MKFFFDYERPELAEIFKPGDPHPFTVLAIVQIIDDVDAVAEPNELQIEFVSHGFDQTDQVLIFLRLTIEITLFVN